MTSCSFDQLGNSDVRLRPALVKLGFVSLGSWRSILDKLPDNAPLVSPGVYAVLRTLPSEPIFLEPCEVQRRGNVITPLSAESLKARWVQGVHVLYFGAAGLRSNRTLGRRLGDMRRHCLGRTTSKGPHKGGEILWQVHGYENFELLVRATEPPPWPRAWECNLISRFLQLSGQLPFANSVL